MSLFLALFLGRASSGLSSVLEILLRMSLFLIFASALGYWVLPKTARFIEKLPISQGLIAFTFITMLFFAWSAEVLGHMAAIIGAFLAGLFLPAAHLKTRLKGAFRRLHTPYLYPSFSSILGYPLMCVKCQSRD